MPGLTSRLQPHGVELRFPYRSLAEQALDRLEAKFGKGYFALAQEVGTIGNWSRS